MKTEFEIFETIHRLRVDLVYKAYSWEQVVFLRGKILALESLLSEKERDDGFA